MGKALWAVRSEGWQEPVSILSHLNVGRRAWLVPHSGEELLAISALCVHSALLHNCMSSSYTGLLEHWYVFCLRSL